MTTISRGSTLIGIYVSLLHLNGLTVLAAGQQAQADTRLHSDDNGVTGPD